MLEAQLAWCLAREFKVSPGPMPQAAGGCLTGGAAGRESPGGGAAVAAAREGTDFCVLFFVHKGSLRSVWMRCGRNLLIPG